MHRKPRPSTDIIFFSSRRAGVSVAYRGFMVTVTLAAYFISLDGIRRMGDHPPAPTA